MKDNRTVVSIGLMVMGTISFAADLAFEPVSSPFRSGPTWILMAAAGVVFIILGASYALITWKSKRGLARGRDSPK
jgi:hypothetical protein